MKPVSQIFARLRARRDEKELEQARREGFEASCRSTVSFTVVGANRLSLVGREVVQQILSAAVVRTLKSTVHARNVPHSQVLAVPGFREAVKVAAEGLLLVCSRWGGLPRRSPSLPAPDRHISRNPRARRGSLHPCRGREI